ncbi:hypothetical protein [Shimia abyssi]|uniref:Neurotransmitter-gated ion-channel n=1 Tax=Shimia abyssi TaxID=1662395 RepID=A0A2P8FC94_9RHOB|nr:hypothetical protein [Shimia abyssi]PSL19302.1 neurotransmitter-gated ion-channel [Shimia abyssi]
MRLPIFHFIAALCVALWGAVASAEGFGDQGFMAIKSDVSEPIKVGVGIKIDQITFVDQQSENYGAVGNFVMRFTHPDLAFDEAEHGGSILSLTVDEYRKYSRDRSVIVPFFVLQNQQGRRFTQQAQIILRATGEVTFLERFTATLQAPYFNFRKYPFDTQRFFMEVTSVFPSSHVEFHPLDNLSGLGELLGEEEWILNNPRMLSHDIEGMTGLPSSQVVLAFEAHRHMQYYMLRILLPLLIILFASWATFFLEEYRRRIDMANANLLVFVAFNFAISTTLPKLGYLTFLDSLFVGMFIITGSMVLVNIGLRRLKIVEKEALARKIDRYLVIWVYPIMYAGFLFWAVRFFLI